MKSIKELEEKRSALIAQGKELVAEETRDLNEEEFAQANALAEEVRELDAQIANEKLSRNADAIVETREAPIKITGDNKIMEKQEELRSLELYVRGQQETDEYRDLTASISAGNATASTPGNGGVTIPRNVEADVIKKLGEVSPVFGLSKQFASVTGVLSVPRQGSLEAAGFTGELENLSQLKPQFETVDLTQKRVGAFIQLTDQVLNDSAVDLMGYSTGYLAQSLGRILEKNILVGAPKGFAPIKGNIAAENLVAFADVAAPTVEELIDLTNGINPYYLPGSVFVVSRAVYNAMSKLKDGNGEYLFFRGDTTTAGHPTFAGFPVYVSESLKDDADSQVYFGNFAAGYGIMVKQGLALTLVQGDTAQVLAGGKMLAITGYMDGAVVDPYAFASAKKA